MGAFGQYIKKHGRPWRVTVPNGKGQLYIEFYDGSVCLRSSQPGVQFDTRIYLTRSAWLRLLPQLVAPTKKMEGPSFDTYRALRESLAFEAQILQEKRARKRAEKTEAKRLAQRQRHRAATRRARRRREEA